MNRECLTVYFKNIVFVIKIYELFSNTLKNKNNKMRISEQLTFSELERLSLIRKSTSIVQTLASQDRIKKDKVYSRFNFKKGQRNIKIHSNRLSQLVISNINSMNKNKSNKAHLLRDKSMIEEISIMEIKCFWRFFLQEKQIDKSLRAEYETDSTYLYNFIFPKWVSIISNLSHWTIKSYFTKFSEIYIYTAIIRCYN
jgi:hypothetical protein